MQINLLPQPSKSRTYWTAGLTALSGILFLLNLFFAVSWVQSTRERALSAVRLNEAQAELAQLAPSLQKWQKNQELQQKESEFQSWAAKRPVFSNDVRLLTSLLPAQGSLVSLSYKGAGAYAVKANLPSMEAVSTYVHDLKQSQRLSSLVVKGITRQETVIAFPPSVPTVTPSGSAGTGASAPLSGQTAPAVQSSSAHQPSAFVPSSSAVKKVSQTGLAAFLQNSLQTLLPWKAEVAYADDGRASMVSPSAGNGAQGNAAAGPGSSTSMGGNGSQGTSGGTANGTGTVNNQGTTQTSGASSAASTIVNYQVELELTFIR